MWKILLKQVQNIQNSLQKFGKLFKIVLLTYKINFTTFFNKIILLELKK